MDDTLRDTVLKPIMKRKRQHQDRRKRKKPKNKCKETKEENVVPGGRRRQQMANVTIKSMDSEELKKMVSSAIEERDFERIVELKEEVDSCVKEMLYPILESDRLSPISWMNKLDRQDVLHLIRSMDPIHVATEHVLTLPTTLSRLYEVSNFELLPSIYHKDHVWLTLQWTIDGVVNPFMSRPCSNTPCLGSYVKGEGEDDVDGRKAEGEPLPELVPLAVLDKMIEWRSQGMTLPEFCEKLREKRGKPRDMSTNLALGRDTPFPPRCLLCYVQEVFSMAMNLNNRLRKSISLDTYKKSCLVQFDDMRKDVMVDFNDYGITWVLKETGVILPKPMIPLPGLLVTMIKRTKNGEVCIDELFDPK